MNLAQEEPGLCRCCHAEGCCKDLTKEYSWMGETEVYGDMLEETFSIKVSEYQSRESINGSKKLICKYCIMRLREAYTFRKQVLANERKLAEMLGHVESEDYGDPDLMVKMEPAESDLKAEPEDIVIAEHGVDGPILTSPEAEPCAKPDPLLIDDEPVSKRRRHSESSTDYQPVKKKTKKPAKPKRRSNVKERKDEPIKYSKNKCRAIGSVLPIWDIQDVRHKDRQMFLDFDEVITKTITTNKRRTYTEDQMRSAVSAVKETGMSVTEASYRFGVPKTTIHDKIKNKYLEGANPGAKPVLTRDEEKQIETWTMYLSDAGFLVSRRNICHLVKNLVASLQRENRFKNGMPGKQWFNKFLTRHPDVSGIVIKVPNYNVTEESIRAWYSRVEAYLKQENLEEVLTDPRRIFNCDESAFYLDPKAGSVIIKKVSSRVNSRTANDEKDWLTVSMTISADGNMPPPLVMFPYQRIPSSITSNMPPKWGVGNSETGALTAEAFFDHITKVFYPWLIENNVTLPVILFMDCRSSYCFNMPLSEFCREKKIVILALPQNCLHAQPIDIAVFRPIKPLWKAQNEGQNANLKREDFAKALEQCLKKAALKLQITEGFKTCGLYPFDPNSIDYSTFKKECTCSVSKPWAYY